MSAGLFTPLTLRGVTLGNRVAISPMCQYSAADGVANDWHFAHLARFALGGAGIVFVEATAVEARGRITPGDLGLWSDDQMPPLRRIARFLAAHGAVPAIQLGHAGRKAATQRPWHGNGPLDDGDRARGEVAWPVVAPSALPVAPGWLMPAALSQADMAGIAQAWRAATLRAAAAGFRIVELHAAHGYLLHQFLSPLTNRRQDAYGGDLAGRMRFPLEMAEVVRAAWPADLPMFTRISAIDDADDGWSLDDAAVFARELAARGVDVVDCSSGGLAGSATAARRVRWPGYQVPLATAIRQAAGLPVMAVGLITDPGHAESIVRSEAADIVAIGREAMANPNWPLQARARLGDTGYAGWPMQAGWWLERRDRARHEGWAAGVSACKR